MTRSIPPVSVLMLALLVPLLSMITTWQGYHYQQPPERVFMGFRYMAGDHFQYAAFMREARDGVGLLMHNPFTSEPQRGVFILPYFWLLGEASRLAGGDVVICWEFFQLLGGALYIVAFWWFTGHYFAAPRARLTATVLFSLAGGLDWIVTVLRAAGVASLKPLEHAYDFFWNWSTFGTMQVPNWVWPALLLLLTCGAALGRHKGRNLVVVVLLPMVWFLHAYSGMVAYLTFGLLPVVPLVSFLIPGGGRGMARERFFRNLRVSLPALGSFVVVALYLLWARSDEVFRINSERGFTWTSSFSLAWYPLSYGLPLVLAFFGLKSWWREPTTGSDLILAWLAAAVLLSINPWYAGVKFQYLVFPPLVMLAARGLLVLEDSSGFVKRSMKSVPRAATLGVLLFMNAPVSLVKDLPAARDDKDIYMPADEIAAMRWLESQPDGLVLCDYAAGNRIPWLSGKRVYLGHWFMTADVNQKAREARAFFSAEVPASIKRAVLEHTRARYVFAGPSEQRPEFSDGSLPMHRVHEEGGYAIYQVDLR